MIFLIFCIAFLCASIALSFVITGLWFLFIGIFAFFWMVVGIIFFPLFLPLYMLLFMATVVVSVVRRTPKKTGRVL